MGSWVFPWLVLWDPSASRGSFGSHRTAWGNLFEELAGGGLRPFRVAFQMPPKKKSKTKSAGAARTKLLWPRKGEWVLACAHAFGTNDVDVYAFVRPARVKYRFGDSVACRQAHYFVLCRPCVKRLADGVPQRELLTDAGAWSNPDPIEIPTEPLPVSGLN